MNPKSPTDALVKPWPYMHSYPQENHIFLNFDIFICNYSVRGKIDQINRFKYRAWCKRVVTFSNGDLPEPLITIYTCYLAHAPIAKKNAIREEEKITVVLILYILQLTLGAPTFDYRSMCQKVLPYCISPVLYTPLLLSYS